MRSIRLSLIVYFLVLLAAALGGISWFAYHSTEQALAAKEKSSSVLFISHNSFHAYDIADRFVILDRGTVAMMADKSEVENAERLVQHMKDFARSAHYTEIKP